MCHDLASELGLAAIILVLLLGQVALLAVAVWAEYLKQKDNTHD